MSEVETVDTPKKRPSGSVKKLIAEDMHSVLQISSHASTISQDATKLLGHESPSLKLVHHSATVKPFVDGSEFSEDAEENIMRAPGENRSILSPPHPARTSLAPPGAPSPPPPPTVASQSLEKLQHSVLQPAETFSQGNAWVSLGGSTFLQTVPNEEHSTTLPSTSLPLPTSSASPTPPPPPPPRLPVSSAPPTPPPPNAPPPPPIGQMKAPSAAATPPPLGQIRSPSAPPPPPPPPKLGTKSSPSTGTSVPPTPALPAGALSSGKRRMLLVNPKNNTAKKLKPYHWLKLTRAVNGSLWAETQMSSEASKAPEINMSELESLFSASAPEEAGKLKLNSSRGPKPEKVLIEHRRAYNCEIMLSKVKVPLQDLMYSVLNLEESALDADQIENLIKFCPTREEMELLKGYNGDKDKLGKSELFFLEMMKVPRVETKLRVFSFKIQFCSQISELRNSLCCQLRSRAGEEFRKIQKNNTDSFVPRKRPKPGND
ncbi:hypothetical protein N665_1104s0006 [Sinapis alba]|nr:hypothetical protein N665_1104s0006 [Sinapis alba]